MYAVFREVWEVNLHIIDGPEALFRMNLHQILVRIYHSSSSLIKEILFLGANHTDFIVEQMRAMENMTMVNNAQCIQFRERNATDPYYLTIFNGTGCYAPVSATDTYIDLICRWSE